MSKYLVKPEDLKKIISREDIPDLLKKMGAENICEIGVRYGEHLSYLLVDNIKLAVAVDIWRETGVVSQNDVLSSQEELDRQYENMLQWAKRDNRLTVIRELSTSASTKFEDSFFDFVYIDADHTEQAVTADINSWWSKVRSGGILSGHDYSPAIVTVGGVVLKFGVIEAVNKFVRNNNLNLYVDKNQSWFIIKP